MKVEKFEEKKILSGKDIFSGYIFQQIKYFKGIAWKSGIKARSMCACVCM